MPDDIGGAVIARQNLRILLPAETGTDTYSIVLPGQISIGCNMLGINIEIRETGPFVFPDNKRTVVTIGCHCCEGLIINGGADRGYHSQSTMVNLYRR